MKNSYKLLFAIILSGLSIKSYFYSGGFGQEGNVMCMSLYKMAENEKINNDEPIKNAQAERLIDNINAGKKELGGIINDDFSDVIDAHVAILKSRPTEERTPDNMLRDCLVEYGTLNEEFRKKLAKNVVVPPLSFNDRFMMSISDGYDGESKCWLNKGSGYCLSVQKIYYTGSGADKTYHMLAFGRPYNFEMKSVDSSHAASGLVMPYVFKASEENVKVLSKSGGFVSGSFGEPNKNWKFFRNGANSWVWVGVEKETIPDQELIYYRLISSEINGNVKSVGRILGGVEYFHRDCLSLDECPFNVQISSEIMFDTGMESDPYDLILSLKGIVSEKSIDGDVVRIKWDDASLGYLDSKEGLLFDVGSNLVWK